MIRRAEFADIPEMLSLSREFYAEMDFDSLGYRFDADQVADSYRRGVENPDAFILTVAEREGELCGIFFAAILDASLYFKGHRFAQEVVWHAQPSLPDVRKSRVMIELLTAAESEMVRMGGMPFYLSTDTRSRFDGVGQYLEKRGYKEMCRYWYKGAK
jgi:hypothetical protein